MSIPVHLGSVSRWRESKVKLLICQGRLRYENGLKGIEVLGAGELSEQNAFDLLNSRLVLVSSI